jgi:hypothetical protein
MSLCDFYLIGERFKTNRTVTGQYATQCIGRASNCEIKLPDSTVTSKEVITDNTIYRNLVFEIIFARKHRISYISWFVQWEVSFKMFCSL